MWCPLEGWRTFTLWSFRFFKVFHVFFYTLFKIIFFHAWFAHIIFVYIRLCSRLDQLFKCLFRNNDEYAGWTTCTPASGPGVLRCRQCLEPRAAVNWFTKQLLSPETIWGCFKGSFGRVLSREVACGDFQLPMCASLAPCFNLDSSSQTVNLLDVDSERALMSVANHSTVWNGNFARELRVGMSSLLRVLRVTGLGFQIFKQRGLKFACSPLASSSGFSCAQSYLNLNMLSLSHSSLS